MSNADSNNYFYSAWILFVLCFFLAGCNQREGQILRNESIKHVRVKNAEKENKKTKIKEKHSEFEELFELAGKAISEEMDELILTGNDPDKLKRHRIDTAKKIDTILSKLRSENEMDTKDDCGELCFIVYHRTYEQIAKEASIPPEDIHAVENTVKSFKMRDSEIVSVLCSGLTDNKCEKDVARTILEMIDTPKARQCILTLR